MDPEDVRFYHENWLQELIAWGLSHGISKSELLDTYYPDEILLIRKFAEMHRARDMMVLLNIVHNPHSEDPQALRDRLGSMCGPGICSSNQYWKKTKLNETQFEQLRNAMSEARSHKRGG
jgi:hypothetical protein